MPQDTVVQDSTRNLGYRRSTRPTFQQSDRFGDPFSNRRSPSPLFPGDPTMLEVTPKLDTADTTINYSIYEKLGDINYRAPTNMSFEEYSELQDRQIRKEYWRDRSTGLDGESAVSGRRLIPPIYTTPVFDRLFGGSFVDIRPNGFVTLDFGGRFQRINNPQVPVRLQRNGTFDFDQQISLNVTGKIGDKLAVTANYDNNNSFDFQNNVKVEYTGYPEEIIKKIEIGNVSLPVSNSLITGSQSLFGLKTQLQFGRLFVTSVASVQRGSSDAVTVEGGSQTRDFEIRGSDYDENRHFFLGHFFRNNYETWLAALPQIISGVNVTRVEVYVLNRNNNTETLRNFAAFMDLGEGDTAAIYRENNPKIGTGAQGPTRNDANQLFTSLQNTPGIRNAVNASEILASDQFNLVKATDFEVITSARKLSEREYTFNSQLGYLSLNRKLQNDEVLAVAFEYTYNGRAYKVGELTEDYQSLPDSAAVFLKLLRPTKINTNVPTWDLMMKNIYSLNATQISREGFQLRVIYRDDNSGIDNPSLHEGENTKDIPLIRLLGLDDLNQNNDPQPDGNFDFVEGITIDPDLGTIIFPVLEPFGNQLRQVISQGDPEPNLINKYVYDALYETTKADAELLTTKNKFFLTGSFIAGSANEITLPGINISEGSVQVIAGNTPLTEGVDYTVDYNLGRVSILNEGVLSSGKTIQITYEKEDLFNFQQRTLLGTRLDYRVNDDINIGATVLYLNERPVITRPSIGDEPTRNTKYGFDINYRKDSRFLTRMVDLLPIVQTKEPSTITFSAEFAQLIPGTSNIINGDGTSYIDDFENTITPFSLGGQSQSSTWTLAATPATDVGQFDKTPQAGSKLGKGYKRAKLAWYTVDYSTFYAGRQKPDNIPKDIINHYERGILPQEVFPQQNQQTINTFLPVFDLAYFPSERGPYNYNPNLTDAGRLPDPETNWGGITRAITSEVDFDKSNIEYIEFWLMDPFINNENGQVQNGGEGTNNTTGGRLVFNLGSVSEDVIPDNRHFFENGLPEDYSSENVQVTELGRVTTKQFLTENFDNTSAETRSNQDVGFDGVRNDQEAEFYSGFTNAIPAPARERISGDISADNFQHYLAPEYNAGNAQIVERYKNFNNPEGNTPIINGNQAFTTAGTQQPDNEDLNRDNTLSDLEEYYEYEIDLRPNRMQVGQNYIVDKIVPDNHKDVTWYLFRIPVRQPDRVQGSIQGFKSIRYIRTYLTGFSQPTVLRFVKFQMVGSQWRRYTGDLYDKGVFEYNEAYDPRFTISVANIEENYTNDGDGSPYRLPPGVVRDRDNTSAIDRRVNEQSIKLCMEDLKDGDSRAAFKNMTLDLINYGSIRMFLHAESETSADSSVNGLLRLGTDFTENYYEIELPLVMSPAGVADENVIWPEANNIDIQLDELYAIKSERNRLGRPITLPYAKPVGKYKITVVGRPDLSNVQTVMIGVRNPTTTTDRAAQSVCIWANELRVGDFDRSSGWAVNARVNTKLADLANVTASARHMTYGFGSIQSKISDRSREETTEYDISANVNVEKMLPQKLGVQVPMYVSYERSNIVPQFDPRDPDIPLDASILSLPSEEKADYLDIVTDQSVRRSLNFTNVKKIKLRQDATPHFYDLANFTFSYAYSDIERSNFNTALYEQRLIRGGVGYNYSFPKISIAPFGNMEALNSPWLALIKDFNFSPLPSSVSVRADLNRSFVKTLLRDANLRPFSESETLYEKAFTFSRLYDLNWNLTNSLALDYGARAYSIIDEPLGEIDTEAKKDTLLTNLKKLGRLKSFDQNITATYAVPFDKLPLTNWIDADVRYGAGYTWQAGAYTPGKISQADTLGNIIQNNRDQSLTGKIDMVQLYNKIKFLQKINTPSKGGTARPAAPAKPSAGAQDSTAAKPAADPKFLKGMLRVLMSLRSINVTYNLGDNTLLPGYKPTPFLFGLSEGFASPGLAFILGSQDPDIRFRARDNGWLATSSYLTMPFQQSSTENIGVRADVEPFRDFRIQLDFKKTTTATYQEIFRRNDSTGTFIPLNPSRSGTYNITYYALPTAFNPSNGDNISAIFQQFEANRAIIQSRLEQENPNFNPETARYNTNSQDVLIPAFLAAYSGQDVNKVKLSPFPKIPLPNWRIDYNGLPRLAPGLTNAFQSLTISHAYNAAYSVNNFNNSLLYENDLELDGRVTDYPFASIASDSGIFVPTYVIQQVTITERFAPLIGINVRMKSSLSGRISYDTERSLALNLSNTQVTELTSRGLTVNIGFTKSKFKLPFRVKGETITLNNDLTFNVAASLKDTKTIQRKIEEENTITNGNLTFQLRPTVDYRVNEKLNVQLYFARTVNDPKVTNSYKRTVTEFGTQVRFNLAQ